MKEMTVTWYRSTLFSNILMLESSSPCAGTAKGGCSHICIPLGVAAYRCACPTFGALVLSADELSCTGESKHSLIIPYMCRCKRSCCAELFASDGIDFLSVPSEFVLYTDSDYGHVGLIVVGGGALEGNLHLIGYSSRPVGVAYDPLLQVLNGFGSLLMID